MLFRSLPDSPETAKFLTKHEKEFLVNRLALETGSGHGRVTNSDKIQLRHIKAAFSEWKIWVAIVCFWANTIGTYGFTATVPSIVQDLGYSSANAQLMTIPIYLFAVICVLTVACKCWSTSEESIVANDSQTSQNGYIREHLSLWVDFLSQ